MALAIALFDEVVFGLREAAWPLIQRDLGLSYGEVGVLLSVPGLVAAAMEPVLGVWADAGRRRLLVVAGGAVYAAALAVVAGAGSFPVLLLSWVALYPASGAFVSLTQGSLMDADPPERERNMARWTLAGSVGVVAGPLAVAGLARAGWGWRPAFWALAALGAGLLLPAARSSPRGPGRGAGLRVAVGEVGRALATREVLRWLAVLELANLMMDVPLGFLALYFVDVVGTSPAGAGLAVAVWTGSGLAGDALLLPVLARVDGLRWLRVGALGALAAFPAFLLAPGEAARLGLLAALGLLTAGWYAVPKARLYAALPDRSGAAMAVSAAAGLVGSAFPVAIGVLASRAGLQAALWVCLAGPVAVLALVGRGGPSGGGD